MRRPRKRHRWPRVRPRLLALLATCLALLSTGKPTSSSLLKRTHVMLRQAWPTEPANSTPDKQPQPSELLVSIARQAPSNFHASVLVEADQTAQLACHLYGGSLDPASNQAKAAHANESPASAVHEEQSNKPQANSASRANEDLVSLIFWYKDDNPVPIYTLDARQAHQAAPDVDKRPNDLISQPLAASSKNERLLSTARHHPASSANPGDEQRLSLDTKSNFPILTLRIERSQASDSGRYRCRVDFRRSPTINQQIALLVQVPAMGLQLSVSSTRLPALEETTLIQANEDEQLEFICTVDQGSPAPKLSWMISSGEPERELSWLQLNESRKLQPIDLASERQRKSAVVSASRLVLGPLNRKQHFNVRIGCLGYQSEPGEWFRELERNYSQHAGATTTDSSRENAPAPSWPARGANGRLNGAPGIMIDDFVTSPNGQKNNELQNGGTKKATPSRTLSKWIKLKLNLKPSRLTIEGAQTNSANLAANSSSIVELVEHKRAELVCRSYGSNPPAKVTWTWLNHSRPQSISDSGRDAPTGQLNAPSSWNKLELSEITWHHHQTELICAATNEAMPADRADRVLSTRLQLLVKFKPVIRLSQIGFDQNASSSAQAQLRCQVRSNPPINQLVWLVNEQPLAKIMAIGEPSAQAGRDPVDHPILLHSGNQLDGPNQRAPSTFLSARRSPIDDDDAYSNNESLNQSGWRFVPALDTPHAAYQYRPGLAWNELLVTTEKNASTAQFQCLAISSFGQTISSKLNLDLPYLPRCSSSPNTSKSNVSFNEISQILGLQVHRITSLHQTNTDTLFDCPVEADPEPLEVAWSYVPLDELTRDPDTLVEQSNLSAQRGEVISKATRLSRDEIISISGRNSPLSRGLLMCRSRNKLGWQHQKACINLLLHTSEQSERPSAENCTIYAQVEQIKEHLSVDVDCSLTVAKERLIFQLAILRQDSHLNSFIANSDNGLTSAQRILFTNSQARGALRISMDEIQANLSLVTPIVRDQVDKRRTRNGFFDADRPTKMTLEEQVELLKSLIFVIRASDLISTSEARAIYGSDLRVELDEGRQSGGNRNKQSLATIQVSRSSGQGDLADDSLQNSAILNGRQASSVRGPNSVGLGHETKLKQSSPYEFEVGITIVAICGVVVLSFLTITLIVIVLNRRDEGGAGRQFRRPRESKKRKDVLQEDQLAQVQLVRLDPGSGGRTLEPAQPATTRDMLALPASSQRSQTGSSSGSSRRASLSGPQFGSTIYKQPCHSHLSLVEAERRMLLGADADVHRAQLIKTDSKLGGQEANETLYLIEANDVCATHSPATTTSPECQPFITLADCELHKQTNGLTSSNFCSSSNHNSLSFCDECSLTVTLTTSDLALIPEVASSSNQKLNADEDSSIGAYGAPATTTVCNKVYLLDPF